MNEVAVLQSIIKQGRSFLVKKGGKLTTNNLRVIGGAHPE
jgi:hypothetical protein